MGKYPTRLERFEEACKNTVSGDRHRNLLKLARLGRLASIDSAELARFMHARLFASDPKRLREVEDAVRKVEGEVPLGGDIPEGAKLSRTDLERLRSKAPPPPPPPPKPARGEATFFERMAAAGREWFEDHPVYGVKRMAALHDLSPVRFSATDWGEQAALMVERLAGDRFGYTFAGEQYSPRDRLHIHTGAELAADIRAERGEIPPQIIANQLTGGCTWMVRERVVHGQKVREGYWSFATHNEIQHYRHAVIEFDGYEDRETGKKYKLPLETQADFWIGCITEETLSPVALVYSGSKSIHGLVRLLELRDREELEAPYPSGGTYLEHYAKLAKLTPETLTPAALWSAQWLDLERLLGSAPDRLYHLDGACKDATRQTRLAGHLREDTHRRQALLYLAEPSSRDLPSAEAIAWHARGEVGTTAGVPTDTPKG